MADETPDTAKSLERYLLLPRAQVGLREVDGRVEPPESKIRPVVITSNQTPDLVGLRSGPRSALLIVDGEAFKVEGCRVEKAFGKGRFYKAEQRATPIGGYLLSVAEKRMEAIQQNNKRLTEEGWPVPYEPEALIHYGKEFRFSPYGIWGIFAKLFGGNPYTISEELAAPVMRIKGDTRLSEFYPVKPQSSGAAQEIAFGIGLMAGAQDKKMGVRTSGITNPKRFSRYLQNFVVFFKDENVYVAKVGDETAFLYRNVKGPREKYKGAEELVSVALTALSGDEEEEEEEEEDRLEEAEDLGQDSLKGMLSRKPYHHRPFREQFWKGYERGYGKPDDRRPVTVADLRAAYGIKLPSAA